MLDSSAVLALIFEEPGAELVESTLPGALISTVNLAEIIAKLIDRGSSHEIARSAVENLGAEIIEFDINQAILAGELRTVTRSLGLSLGDRACLALARERNLPAMTSDTSWGKLPNVNVILIRNPA